MSREQATSEHGLPESDRRSVEPGADGSLRATIGPYAGAALLLSLAEQRATGSLDLASDVGRRVIHLHSGLPVFAQSSLMSERLGTVGVRHAFVGRDDVARALATGRAQERELGQALIEVGVIEPAGLYALLAVQTREVVAAACGAAPQRARFSPGRLSREVIVLRLHPLTAALHAVAALPAVDQAALLAALSPRRVAPAALSASSQRWLGDLGYLGDLASLHAGEATLGSLRTRLLARQRTGTERAFEAAHHRYAAPGKTVLLAASTPAAAADLVALALLLGGSLRLLPGDLPPSATSAEPSSNAAEAVQRTLAELSRSRAPALELPASAAVEADDAEAAIEAYLHAPRDKARALASAVWGASVEADDPALPAELLRAYVTLRTEPSPALVLGTTPGDGAEAVAHAHARRTEQLAPFVGAGVSTPLRCRALELQRRFDDARQALLAGRISLRPPEAQGGLSSASGLTSPGRLSAPGVPRNLERAERASVPPRSDRASFAPRTEPPRAEPPAFEALAVRVDALLRAGHYREVTELLDPQKQTATLPFALQLARAIAQRELGGRPSRARVLLLIALALLAGFLVRHAGYGAELPRLF